MFNHTSPILKYKPFGKLLKSESKFELTEGEEGQDYYYFLVEYVFTPTHAA